MNCIFMTGTDTGVGKTTVSAALMRQLNNAGYKTFGIKPLASGGSLNSEGVLVNEDALCLQQSASIKREYSVVNPLIFEDYIAPHLAAKNAGVRLTASSVMEALKQSIQAEADFNIIEGAGGWSVPLNDYELISDVITTLKIPTILVVGVKLGCLNHAILTQESIMQSQVPFLGWIGNRIEADTLAADENIETLKQWLKVPMLGIVPYGIENHLVNQWIDIDHLLNPEVV